jgi:hypothetical protein
MTRYLDVVIAQARGAAPQIRPRLRSRFEPEARDSAAGIDEDRAFLDAPPPPPPSSPSAPPAAPAHASHLSQAVPAAAAAPAIREHTHRVHATTEVVERRTRDAAPTSASAPDAAPPRTTALVIERVTERRHAHAAAAPSAEGPPPAASPARGSAAEPTPPSQAASAPATASDSAPARADARMPAMLPPPFLMAGQPDGGRPPSGTAAEAAPAAPEPPEITISIGVLDIRLLQEGTTDRDHAARTQGLRNTERNSERKAPLPLADYLAGRTGSTS